MAATGSSRCGDVMHGTRQAFAAAGLYLVATLAITWPLVRVMHHQIASDQGDPLFGCWIMLWNGGNLLSFLSGDFSALSRYWNANIFYPEPLTLAYAEHLTAEMLQALPVLAATDNVILAYNLVFIATFVLSGLGMFLLVRDITGRPLAAFVAGLAFAFTPYRIDQLPHIQILSAQWMPFALYGFRRYLESGRRRALAGGAAALIANNWSCGYYTLFFTPFAAAYVIYELARRRRLGDWTAWRAFAAAGLVVAALTLPFLTPYLHVRTGGVGVRSANENAMYGADVHAFATAPSRLWLWGERMAALRKGEGQAFPGFAILALALTGIASALLRNRSKERPPLPAWRQAAVGALAVLLAAYLYALIRVLVTGRFTLMTGGAWVLWLRADQVLAGTLVLLVALFFLIKRRPANHDASPGSEWPFYAVAALTAAILALGPIITVKGAIIAPGPYALLMKFVPGFDGLRVPARYVMLVTLFLAVLAGVGASELMSRARRLGKALAIVAGALILVESWPGAFQINSRIGVDDTLQLAPAELGVGRRLPPLYKTIRDNDQPIVLLEFPFGSTAWDVQAVFYSGYHRKHLVNGYSGFFPESHVSLIRALNQRGRDPQVAWSAVLNSGATHILVHTGAYLPGHQEEITQWLLASGAHEILADGTDRLFTIR
jgi:hypothetical protein